ncbi:MAG TPA: alanine racemase, partial [Candidatus Babeliaceae bacterium]|nr:alanine racemase [Candidatus Babeliaceae bacterium]
MNPPYGHPAWIEIDLQQFKQNIFAIRRWVGKSLICLPVKANAYGHGLVPIAQAAVQAGVNYLGVSCLQEGAILRQAGITIPIMVFGAIHEEQMPELLYYDLECTISSLLKAQCMAKKCLQLKKICKVHIEVDTGMRRTGVRPETAT